MNTVAQKLAPPQNTMFPPLIIWPVIKRMRCERSTRRNFCRECGREPKKGGWTRWLLGPGPGQPWQWLMRSDWAVLPCSGGSEPCSARETFQPLSPLSGAIHSTEYSPQGLVVWGGCRKKAQGGTGRGGGKGLEEQGSAGRHWAENWQQTCRWVHGIFIGWGVRELKRDGVRWCLAWWMKMGSHL